MFSIKDLERLSGIKAHTIRIWEQRYNFLKPQRSLTNIRLYDNEELKTLLNVALLNKYGYKISRIDKMSVAEMQKNIFAFTNADAEHDRLINELIHHMIDLNSFGLEETLNSYIRTNGIERTINHLVFPFLEKIGILWQSNRINIAQEHLVSNIIRQKLIVALDSVIPVSDIDKEVLIFLPEGEHHELGILFMCFLFKQQGLRTLYLGANLPMKDLEFVALLKKPDHIFTHITCIPRHFSIDKFVSQLATRIPDIPVTISGKLALTSSAPSSIVIKSSVNEVLLHVLGDHPPFVDQKSRFSISI